MTRDTNHAFSLILMDTTRLPSALTGLALRVEKFTVTKMSSCRWMVEVPQANQATVIDLLDTFKASYIDAHEITPLSKP